MSVPCLESSPFTTAQYRRKYCLKGLLNSKQPSNQIPFCLSNCIQLDSCPSMRKHHFEEHQQKAYLTFAYISWSQN